MKASLFSAATLSLLAALPLAGCTSSSDSSPSGGPADTSIAQSSAQRITTPNVPTADADALRDGNAAFATDFYGTLANDADYAGKNLFFSPYSISLALAMTYAGARNATATQMATALHFTLPEAKLDPAFDALDLALSSRGQGAAGDDGKAFRLRVANSVWGAKQASFVPAFLDTLAENYGAGVRLTDFETNPEAARNAINGWVDQETEDKIKELLPAGTVNSSTRLVLVNALYFNAAWKTPFEPRSTHAGTFHGDAGDTAAQLMTRTDAQTNYAKGDGWQAVSVPYDGQQLSFVAVLPDDLGKFEKTLSTDTLATINAGFSQKNVTLELPKFKIPGASVSLKDALASRGMVDAFDPGKADFSGMSGEKLHISDVIHQAFISVDEAGTEAAAATAVLVVGGAAPDKPIALTFDKPFVFFIRDDATGAVLFLGRVLSL